MWWGWSLPLVKSLKFAEVLQLIVDADPESLRMIAVQAISFGDAYIQKTDAISDMRQFLYRLVQTNPLF